MSEFVRHSPTSSLRLAALAAISLALAACGPGPAEDLEDRASRSQSIIGGTLTKDFPAVGRLFAGDLNGPGSFCSASLIGKRTVLTAAHCIVPGDVHHFITDDDKAYKASSAEQHHGWDPNHQNYPNDIGIVHLAIAPAGIKPVLITDRAPSKGQALTIVGFGETSHDRGDAGDKRRTTNTIEALYSTRFTMSGAGGGQGNICQGDSGGPSFATIGGTLRQVGVHSATQIPCGTRAYDTRVDAFLPWIKQKANGDLYEPDTTPPQVTITTPANGATVGSTFTLVVSATDPNGVAEVVLQMDGQLASKKSGAPFTFAMTNVPEGTRTFVATARDIDGNAGSAQIQVEVSGGPKSGFGEACDGHARCESGLCAAISGVRFCTQRCGGSHGDCPQSAECLDASGGTFVCGAPVTPGSTTTTLSTLRGGCSIPTTGDTSPVTLLLLALLWIVLKTRR